MLHLNQIGVSLNVLFKVQTNNKNQKKGKSAARGFIIAVTSRLDNIENLNVNVDVCCCFTVQQRHISASTTEQLRFILTFTVGP